MNPSSGASTLAVRDADDDSSTVSTSPLDLPARSPASSVFTTPNDLRAPSPSSTILSPSDPAQFHIKDFRAATNLLSILQKERYSFLSHDTRFFAVSALPPDNESSEVDLQPLNALATLLVRDKEVVAVTCRREQGGVVRFVACVDYGVTTAQPNYGSDQVAASRDSEVYTPAATTQTPNPSAGVTPKPYICNPTMKPATSKVKIRSLDELAQHVVNQ